MSNLVCYLATLVHAGARSVELRESEVDEFAASVVVALTDERQRFDYEAMKDSIRRGDAMFMGVPIKVARPRNEVLVVVETSDIIGFPE